VRKEMREHLSQDLDELREQQDRGAS